jgi:hypothetical protein
VAKGHKKNLSFLFTFSKTYAMFCDMDRTTLTAHIHYDPVTGVFTRRRKWGSKPAGSVIGCLSPQGYWQIGVCGRTYAAHRLAWLYMTGDWPAGDIDHINRTRADNRFTNLRAVSRSENLQNARRRDNNTSGYTGVSWSKSKKRWRANIMVLGRPLNLGYFKNIADAVAAREKAASQLHPFRVP